jgi:hypothetical protein
MHDHEFAFPGSVGYGGDFAAQELRQELLDEFSDRRIGHIA